MLGDMKNVAINHEPIQASLTGIIRAGIVAIGGETSGIILETEKGAFELDFGTRKELRQKAEQLNGMNVTVVGVQSLRDGIEGGNRRIVSVTGFDDITQVISHPPAPETSKIEDYDKELFASFERWLEKLDNRPDLWMGDDQEVAERLWKLWVQEESHAIQDKLARDLKGSDDETNQRLQKARALFDEKLTQSVTLLRQAREKAVEGFQQGVKEWTDKVTKQRDAALKDIDNAKDALHGEIARELENARAGLTEQMNAASDTLRSSTDAAFKSLVEADRSAREALANNLKGVYQAAVDRLSRELTDNVNTWVTWHQGNSQRLREWLSGAVRGSYSSAVQFFYDQWNQGNDAVWNWYASSFDNWENWLNDRISYTYATAADWLEENGGSVGGILGQILDGLSLTGPKWLSLPDWGSLPNWAQNWINGYIDQFNAGVRELDRQRVAGLNNLAASYRGLINPLESSLNNAGTDWLSTPNRGSLPQWAQNQIRGYFGQFQSGIDSLSQKLKEGLTPIVETYQAMLTPLQARLNDVSTDWVSIPDFGSLPAWSRGEVAVLIEDFNEVAGNLNQNYQRALDSFQEEYHATLSQLQEQYDNLVPHWQAILNDRLAQLDELRRNLVQNWQDTFDAGIADLARARDNLLNDADRTYQKAQTSLEDGLRETLGAIEAAGEVARGELKKRAAQAGERLEAASDWIDRHLGVHGKSDDTLREDALRKLGYNDHQIEILRQLNSGQGLQGEFKKTFDEYVARFASALLVEQLQSTPAEGGLDTEMTLGNAIANAIVAWLEHYGFEPNGHAGGTKAHSDDLEGFTLTGSRGDETKPVRSVTISRDPSTGNVQIDFGNDVPPINVDPNRISITTPSKQDKSTSGKKTSGETGSGEGQGGTDGLEHKDGAPNEPGLGGNTENGKGQGGSLIGNVLKIVTRNQQENDHDRGVRLAHEYLDNFQEKTTHALSIAAREIGEHLRNALKVVVELAEDRLVDKFLEKALPPGASHAKSAVKAIVAVVRAHDADVLDRVIENGDEGAKLVPEGLSGNPRNEALFLAAAGCTAWKTPEGTLVFVEDGTYIPQSGWTVLYRPDPSSPGSFIRELNPDGKAKGVVKNSHIEEAMMDAAKDLLMGFIFDKIENAVTGE